MPAWLDNKARLTSNSLHSLLFRPSPRLVLRTNDSPSRRLSIRFIRYPTNRRTHLCASFDVHYFFKLSLANWLGARNLYNAFERVIKLVKLEPWNEPRSRSGSLSLLENDARCTCIRGCWHVRSSRSFASFLYFNNATAGIAFVV